MGIYVEEKSYPKKHLTLVIIASVISIALITGIFAFSDVISVKNSGTVNITDGMTVSGVAEYMKENEIIRFPLVFRLMSRIKGYDTKIRTGQIEVQAGMSYTEILNELINAQPETVKVVIPEGYEIGEIAEKLSVLVPKEEFYEALKLDYDYKFLKDLPEREMRLEGYLFPATYAFPLDYTAEEIVNTMLKAFDEAFLDEYYDRANELGMTVDQIVTLASIIERESNSGEDRAKVAGVFYNRLEQNMRLQSCATVQYILKERKTVLSTADTKIDSPYNTYMNSGLPIGPIASPGEECIKAALYPEDTTALYFVLGSDGKHIFSDTYDEHLNAKNGG